jgi:hypothetical protein
MPGRRSRRCPRRAWRPCAPRGAWSASPPPTTKPRAWGASTRPWWRRPRSAWPARATPGRPWPAANCTGCKAWSRASRCWAIRCSACSRWARCWPRRCRARPRAASAPVPSRRPRWPWKWPPPSCTWTPASRTASSTIPNWACGCSIWPSASRPWPGAPARPRWKSGWKTCTAASATARLWAAWCTNCGPRCRRWKSRSTTTSASPALARCLSPCRRSSRPCAACCRCWAWTRPRRPWCRCATRSRPWRRPRSTRSAPSKPAPSTGWPTTSGR